MDISLESLGKCRRQRGAAALLITLVLLVAITLVTLYTAGPIRTEQQVTANEYRALQALNAAEAGQYYFLGVVRQQIEAGGDPVPLALLDPDPAADPPACLTVLDPDGDGLTRRTFVMGGQDTLIRLLNRNLQLVETRDCREWGQARIPPDVFFVEVSARGFSDDLQGQRLVRQLVEVRRFSEVLPPGGVLRAGISPPTSPLVTLEGIDLNGNFDMLALNADGEWSPDEFGAGFYKAVSGADVVVPPGANRNITEDQVEGESDSLKVTEDGAERLLTPDEFFFNFLGADKETVKSFAYEVSGPNIDATTVQAALAAGNNVIWVSGDARINTSGSPNDPANWMGTPGAPITLIVEGTLSTQGNQQIHGMVYAMDNIEFGGGTIDIFGTLLGEKEFTRARGTMNIHYNPNSFGGGPDLVEEGVLETTQTAETGGVVPGTWVDF
jgi:hypothetical protein